MTLRALAWLCVAPALVAACSSSLREVRARPPEFRFGGVPASGQLEVARCIRDVLDRSAGDDILQEIELAPDGIHVVGGLEESLATTVFYDVAVREDAIVARVAPRSVIPPEMLRSAITACHPTGAGG